MTPPSGAPVVVYSGPTIPIYVINNLTAGVYQFTVDAGVLSGPPCPSVSCTVQVVLPEVCNNGIDDDLDSLIDCADPDCATDPACGCWPETQQMTPGLGSGYVFAGMSVSVSGDVMVVGIADADGASMKGGDAYIYLLDPQTGQWIQFQQLQDPNGTAVDHFGYSVSVSGDVIVIGEPGHSLLDTGRAFVYERDPQSGLWLEVDQLTASNPFPGNSFGASVSVSGDVLVVGAFDYINGSNQGSVYLFERDINGAWLQTQELSDLGGGGLASGYGSSVSIMDDVIVVGQPHDDVQGIDSGSVLVYELDNLGFWQETQKLLQPGGTIGDGFGSSVDICDDVIAIGVPGDDDQGPDSGSAFVFERDNAGIWQPTPLPLPSGGAPVDHFGSAVSISANTIVIGSQWDDDQGPNSGSAFVYQRDTLTGPWLETEKLLASDGAQEFWFGSAVSISGETIAVAGGYYFVNGGGPGWPIGRAYIYTLDPTCQLPSLEVCDNGIDDDCDGWIDCEDPDCAGFSVWQPPVQLLDPNGAAGDWFGISVAVSGDTIVVGSQYDDDQGSDSGSAFVFERVGGVWQPPVQLLDPNGAAGDWFGWSVAVSGDTIVVGSRFDDDQGTDSGSAFVFEPLCPSPAEICGNGIDDDNDGLIDCDDSNCIGEINCIGNGFAFIAPVIDVNYPENTGEASFDVLLSIQEDPTSAGFPSETQAFSMALIYDRDLIEATSIELSDILLETLGVPPVFFQADASPGSVTASVVFDGAIQFDDEIPVLNVGFQTNPEVIAGSTGSSVRALVWADSAALANLVIVSGEPIAPQFIDGAVTLHPVSNQPPINNGDPNGDGSIDISDTITLLNYLFSAAVINCVAAGDVNGDNQIDVADPIFLLTYIFGGGPPPVGGTECAPDSTPADPPFECEDSFCDG
ncbi:MAG: dockerin type I domain-containing protein [Planctomycetota bacterium]